MPFKLPMAVLAGALSLALGAPLPALAASSEVTTIVGDTRPSAELTDKELRRRMQTLKEALDDANVSDATRKELRALMRSDRAEQESRGGASTDSGGGETPAPDTSTADSDPSAENAGGGSEVATIDSVVSSTQPSASLSDEALAGRLAELESGLSRGELPRSLRRELKAMQDADLAELERRKQAVLEEQPAVEEPTVTAEDPVQEQPATASESDVDEPTAAETATKRTNNSDAVADARQLLLSSRSLDQLSERDLRKKLTQAKRLLDDRGLPGNLRGKLTDLSAKLRSEIRRRGTVASADPGGDEPVTTPTVTKRTKEQGGDVSTASRQSATDKLALVYLNDKTRVERLPRDELRERLEAYRKLLASGQLSPAVEDQLRAKLKRERALLRERVAVEEVQASEAAARKKKKGNEPRVIVKVAVPEPTFTEAPRLADDTRRANELNERQLNRRILAYRVLNRNERVSAQAKARYRERLRADRAELRRRLLEDKRRRVIEVREQPKIQVNVDLGRNAGVTLWAAEAGDEEIERQLVARPVRRIRERYSRRILLEQPERIVLRDDVRESLPSVEIDTINFGFNEAFVAEEEIADLDRIGTILERILANHPDEVFLIEGHTDAVGSDAYNLRLSLERARAVKAALIDYYAISPDNLSVVGLGERYLKIPTLDEEEENRRVTVRRMTPLMSDYDFD
jgi:outer membrane protein OmpA-like peptidoglycan-associated protein